MFNLFKPKYRLVKSIDNSSGSRGRKYYYKIERKYFGIGWLYHDLTYNESEAYEMLEYYRNGGERESTEILEV